MAARKRMAAKHRTRVELSSTLESTAKQLKRLGVWRQFCNLAEDGCETDALLVAFAAVVAYAERDNWIELFRFPRLQLPSALKMLENCANVVEKLNRSQAAYELAQACPELDVAKLPQALRCYSQFFKTKSARRSGFNLRGRPNFNSARARITAYVAEMAKRPHDPELAHIFSVLTGRNITEEAQKVWRHENAALIRKADRFLPMAKPPAPR